MKNYILISLFFISIKGHAQIMKFQAVQFICPRFQNALLDPPEFHDCKNMPVEWDMDSSFVYIHSPSEQIFHFNKSPIAMEEKDSVLTTQFKAKNMKTYTNCYITLKVYERGTDKYFASITIQYPDNTYIYNLQKMGTP